MNEIFWINTEPTSTSDIFYILKITVIQVFIFFSVCNRTYYGDVGKTYDLTVNKSKDDRLPFLCHLTFTANGQTHGDIVQVERILKYYSDSFIPSSLFQIHLSFRKTNTLYRSIFYINIPWTALSYNLFPSKFLENPMKQPSFTVIDKWRIWIVIDMTTWQSLESTKANTFVNERSNR